MYICICEIYQLYQYVNVPISGNLHYFSAYSTYFPYFRYYLVSIPLDIYVHLRIYYHLTRSKAIITHKRKYIHTHTHIYISVDIRARNILNTCQNPCTYAYITVYTHVQASNVYICHITLHAYFYQHTQDHICIYMYIINTRMYIYMHI